MLNKYCQHRVQDNECPERVWVPMMQADIGEMRLPLFYIHDDDYDFQVTGKIPRMLFEHMNTELHALKYKESL